MGNPSRDGPQWRRLRYDFDANSPRAAGSRRAFRQLTGVASQGNEEFLRRAVVTVV